METRETQTKGNKMTNYQKFIAADIESVAKMVPLIGQKAVFGDFFAEPQVIRAADISERLGRLARVVVSKDFGAIA